jgi:TFIIF-interacting CTD phosphatase-like protein
MNKERKSAQSKLCSKIKTKYEYLLYKDNILIEKCNYSKLVELGLKNSLSMFYEKKSNDVVFKGYRIIRVKIEDIVQPEGKLSDR